MNIYFKLTTKPNDPDAWLVSVIFCVEIISIRMNNLNVIFDIELLIEDILLCVYVLD